MTSLYIEAHLPRHARKRTMAPGLITGRHRRVTYLFFVTYMLNG